MGHKNKELLQVRVSLSQMMSSSPSSGGYALRSKGVPPPPTTTPKTRNSNSSRYSLRSGGDVPPPPPPLPIRTRKIHKPKPKPKPRLISGSIDNYMKMADESDGFDVCDLGSLMLSGEIQQMYLGDDDVMFDVIEATVHAIEVHNVTKNSDLDFVRLVKVNGQIVGGFMYYITFMAHSHIYRQTKTYQAKVWSQINGNLFLRIFREKPQVYTTPNKHGSSSEEAKSISIPDIAFESFLNVLRRLPELGMKKPCYIATLASDKWRSMSHEEKMMYHETRSLKYQDIAGLVELRDVKWRLAHVDK